MKNFPYTFKIALILLSSTIASISNARLNIEITQGVTGAVPIAVVSIGDHAKTKPLFFDQEETEFNDFSQLAKVIRQNLRASGRFEPHAIESVRSNIDTSQSSLVDRLKNATIDLKYWQNVGVENLIIGDLQKNHDDTYSVSFKLIDIFTSIVKTANPVVNDDKTDHVSLSQAHDDLKIMLAKSYTNIQQKDLRYLAHHISDLIYERLTGIKGAFSTKIAYVLVANTKHGPNYSLEIADVDGFNPKTLVSSKEPIMSPAWSPDAKKLAFVSFEKNRAEIYLIDIVSGKRELLSHFPGINGAPAWSKDGTKLALVLSKDGSPKIFVMDIASRQIKQVTHGFSIDTEPQWSKDGKNIYFTSNRGGRPQIYKIDLATSDINRVTFAGDYNARPMLSPDEKYMVMIHRNQPGKFHIATMDLASKDVNIITRSKFDDSPTLAPNGAMVLYGTQKMGKRVLGLVTIDGRGHMSLPARNGHVQEPAWSPFLS